MTKRLRKITATFVATIMASSFIITVSAATDTEKKLSGTGSLSGVGVSYSNTVEQTKAKATTSIGNDSVVTVSGSYTYINTNTFEVKTVNNGNGDRRTASVVFYAPKNCTTVKLISNHSASHNGQNWSVPNVTNVR